MSGASNNHRRPVLKDVAQAAGVHLSTVSRVLSGTRPVSPDIAMRVRKAVDDLGYRANPIGRALSAGRTGIIGMVVPDLTNPFFPALVQSVDHALNALGVSLILSDAENNPKRESERVRSLLDGRVDALLISPVDTSASLNTIRAAAREALVVQIDRSVDAGVDSVRADQATAMKLVLGHLTDRGRTSFAFVTTHDRISTTADRLDAWRAWFANNPTNRDDVHLGSLSPTWGYQATAAIADRSEMPDAIVCANDMIAIGALQLLHERGIRVPEDVAVVGFDDTEVGFYSQPALTTVRQPIERMGIEAVHMLLEAERDRSGGRHVVLTPELVVRHSS